MGFYDVVSRNDRNNDNSACPDFGARAKFSLERLFAKGNHIDVYRDAYGETAHGCDQVEF